MKSILIGSIAFIIWSSISTYYYVCNVKDLPYEQQNQFAESTIPETEPEIEEEPEPETVILSPGSFTIYHLYNHLDFTEENDFSSYLDQLKKYMHEYPTSVISITGYADNIGSEQYNYTLGMGRANFIRNHLIDQGIPKSIIEISSDGETSPVASNASNSGRAENRRSEITIKTN